MKPIRVSLWIAEFLIFWSALMGCVNEGNNLTIRHPNGNMLHEATLEPGESFTDPAVFLDEEVQFQGYYESPLLQTRYEETIMPDADVTVYAAYTDSEGFMALSDIPEMIGDKEVRDRFATNRQGFVRAGSSLHYIGGVGPHLTNDSGDFSGFDYYSDLHIAYDLESHAWTLHPDLPTDIGFLDAVASQDAIYILGGEWIDDQGFMKQENLRYDLDTQTYHAIADPPFDFQASNGSVLHEGKIYVFTGTKQTLTEDGPSFESVDETLIYDIASDSWTEGTPAPFKTSSGSAAVVNGHIYVYRSASSNASHFARYDPGDDTWEDGLQDPEHHVSHSSSVMHDGKLVISGGWKTGINGTSGAIQAYDPASDSWEAMAELKSDDGGGIGYVAQYAYGDSLYYLGGESHTEDRQYESHHGLYQFKEEWITP